MQITICKDGSGFLAEVEGNDYLFAYGDTEEEAKRELLSVLEMMIECQLK